MNTLIAISPYLGFVTRPLIMFFVLLGLWLGLRRTSLSSSARLMTWGVIACLLIGWFFLMTWLGQTEVYRSYPWTLRAAAFFPAVLWLVLLMRSQRIAAVIDAIPPSWLIGMQTYRVLGGVFVLQWLAGRIPGLFALPAGIGDLLVGLFALLTALYVARRAPRWHVAGYAWNLFGLADLALGLSIAMFIGTVGLRYPLTMIPTFIVPLSIVLHVLSLWQLSRVRAAMPSAAIEHRQLRSTIAQ